MNNIIELKNKITATKSQIEKLNALLAENELTDLELLTPALVQRKNELLVDLKLGLDVSDELVKIEERIIAAQKADAKNKQNQTTQREFVKSIQTRIDSENAALSAITTEYKRLAADYLMGLVEKSESAFKKLKSQYEREIIAGEALEKIVSEFDGGFHTSCLTDNRERYLKLWRNRGGNSESYESQIDVDTSVAIKSLRVQLEKVGIQQL